METNDILFNDEYKGLDDCNSVQKCMAIGDYDTVYGYMEKHPDQAEQITAVIEHNYPADAAMAEVPREAAWVIVLIILIQTGIFIFSMFGLYKLWKDILNFISNSTDSKIKHLLSAIGGTEVSYSKTKIMGTGIAASIIILAIAVAAMWVIGNVRIY